MRLLCEPDEEPGQLPAPAAPSGNMGSWSHGWWGDERVGHGWDGWVAESWVVVGMGG